MTWKLCQVQRYRAILYLLDDIDYCQDEVYEAIRNLLFLTDLGITLKVVTGLILRYCLRAFQSLELLELELEHRLIIVVLNSFTRSQRAVFLRRLSIHFFFHFLHPDWTVIACGHLSLEHAELAAPYP